MNKTILHDIISTLVEYADELKSRPNLNEVERGELLGYAETLSVIRDACPVDERADIGLDFDVDERYLQCSTLLSIKQDSKVEKV
ncbi:MAG: hypothetical protein LUE22_03045 [Oscillospiraceae bacterium]|nr:hypothetical protein [Oscillospiraceae bacterium]